ncbi:Outer envelope protein 64 [Cardamine amara subsp. amara]|uniref:Outer envelope protein 64 n=1 Tax=Cardamine amara subsp. amara TaxID=228776 RepID=A0ABD1B4I9_CARAN
MARSPSKHGRDQTQDWELSLKDKDKKIKQQPTNSSNSNSEKYGDFVKKYGDLSSSFVIEEGLFDSNSEKEQGNEYFKQKKFVEAIDCYSRSIALSPNAVTFANRAMAYLKIKRYREAEVDCTEALNLDDRYIKAYSRRATARKELGMIKEAKEDAEFALRLEPQSQELKKQYADIKSLLEKEIIEKASGAMHSTAQELLKTAGLDKKTKMPKAEINLTPVTLEAKTNKDTVQPVSGSKESSRKKLIESVPPEEKNKEGSKKTPVIIENVDSRKVTPRSQSYEKESSDRNGTQASGQGNPVSRKLELKPSVQELAAHAASLAMVEVSKNIKAPKSAYEFENTWRSFSGDRSLQTQLLKVMTPSSLPQVFKNALTSPVLVDIIKCVASFFTEDMDLAVKYIENLTKVPRFNMLIMCLTSTEKNELLKIWDDVFCNKATPMEYADGFDKLRSLYCVKH